MIDAVGLSSTNPASAAEIVPSSLQLGSRRLAGGALLACSPPGSAGAPKRLCSGWVRHAPSLGFSTRLLSMSRRPSAVPGPRSLWVVSDPFPVRGCAPFDVLLAVSKPSFTASLTEHWVITPSLTPSSAFVGMVHFRMLLLPFDYALAYALQPLRLGMSPLPNVVCVARFATRPMTIR